MNFDEVAKGAAVLIEGAGVAVIVVGSVWASLVMLCSAWPCLSLAGTAAKERTA